MSGEAWGHAGPTGVEPLERLPGDRFQLHLTGFMGSGKSTVGRLLARRLVWNFLDLDAVVARLVGRPVPEIFASEGEQGFRDYERQALRQVVQKPRTVVALGGGTLIDPANRAVCAASAEVVWLDVPLPVARARLRDEAGDRPLWGEAAELEARFRERLPGYRSAGIRVDASGAPEAVAVAVLEALGVEYPAASRGPGPSQEETGNPGGGAG